MASDCRTGNSHFLGSDHWMGYPFYASEKKAVKTMTVNGRRNLQLIVRSKLWLGLKENEKFKLELASIKREIVGMEGKHQIPKTTCFFQTGLYRVFHDFRA